MVRDIVEITVEDGVSFDGRTATAEAIREDGPYSGVRVSLTGSLATARLTFHVDVNVGDPIWPAPRLVAVPRLLGGSIEVVGYQLPTVLAEKINGLPDGWRVEDDPDSADGRKFGRSGRSTRSASAFPFWVAWPPRSELVSR